MIKWIKIFVVLAFLIFFAFYINRYFEYRRFTKLSELESQLQVAKYTQHLINDGVKVITSERFVNYDTIIYSLKRYATNLDALCDNEFIEKIAKKSDCRRLKKRFAKEQEVIERILQESALMKSSILYLPTIAKELMDAGASLQLLKEMQEIIEKLSYQISLSESIDKKEFEKLLDCIDKSEDKILFPKLVQNFLDHAKIIYYSLQQLHRYVRQFHQTDQAINAVLTSLEGSYDRYLALREKKQVLLEGILILAILLFTILLLVLIIKEERIEKELEFLAMHDYLTKLPNRHCYTKDVKSFHPPYYAVKFNVDNFTYVIDDFGEEAGDQVLAIFASIIKQYDCKVYHVADDEFVAFMIGENSNLVEVMYKKISLEFKRKTPFAATLSAGAVAVKGQMSSGTLNHLLQAAVYSAKKQGGDRLIIYNENDRYIQEYQHFSQKALEKRNELLTILEKDQLQLFYQPIFDIQNNRVEKYEVLLRVDGPIFRNIQECIEYAERFNLVDRITRYVIDKSFKTIEQYGLALSINLSAQDIVNDAIKEHIFQKMQEYDIAPSLVTFEVTETDMVEDLQKGLGFLQELKEAGFLISVDDFGSGYSSLRYLKQMPAEIIKIDGIFIKDIDRNEESREFVKNLIKILKTAKKKVVAEYVENERIYQILKDLDVEYAQGYYIGKPAPIEEWIKGRDDKKL